jgi:hypothetical protein
MSSNWLIKKAPADYFSKSKMKGESWFFLMECCWENDKYVVCSRKVENFEHVAICRKDGKIVTWIEKQEIKDELFGEERIAIEIYPKHNEIINDSNVYHLWIYEGEGNEIEKLVLK